jgi:hypothetical protein
MLIAVSPLTVLPIDGRQQGSGRRRASFREDLSASAMSGDVITHPDNVDYRARSMFNQSKWNDRIDHEN